MALQDDLRAQLIKQFDADVLVVEEKNGEQYYACPTCKRHIAMSNKECQSCGQKLNWEKVRLIQIEKNGIKKASLSFEVPGDFVKSDCRRCPLSYIAKVDGENMYNCPMGHRNHCPLVFDK